MSPSENNKRIVKNTLMLYIRMILVMGVNLYIVRIVLQVLGEVDYGIYNVVAGVIVMISFFSGTMSSASQRFFAFELGKQNKEKLKKTFSVTVSIYLLLSVIILVLLETVGLWFLNNKMTIPADRMSAANWVFQFSILSFLMTMFAIPYKSLIIAYEKMSIYAYISIFEVGLRLMLVFALTLLQYDKLIVYAFLMFCVAGLTFFSFRFFCQRHFSESKFSFIWDGSLFKSILSYSGWNMFGSLAAVMNNHGVNILLNLFFGPVVNAARGIAFQFSNGLNQFVQNFVLAIKPQVTKYYAAGDNENMISLVYRSSKFSFFLLLLLTTPFLLESSFIMTLWLSEVPDYLIVFLQLIIVNTLVDSLSYSLLTAAQAQGKMRRYQIIVGGTLLMNIPISYLFLKAGYEPQVTMHVGIIFSFLAMCLRLLLLTRLIPLTIIGFFRHVFLRVMIVVTTSTVPLFYFVSMFPEGTMRFVISATGGILITILSISFFGVTKSERSSLWLYFRTKFPVW
jgi:O-antigen/teichoic acid export membrane protein